MDSLTDNGSWFLQEYQRTDDMLHTEYRLPGLDEGTLRPALNAEIDEEMIGGGWKVPDGLLAQIAANYPSVKPDTRYQYQLEFVVTAWPDDDACPNGHPRYDLDARYEHRPYHVLIDLPRHFLIGVRWPFYYNPERAAYQWICDVCAAPLGEAWSA